MCYLNTYVRFTSVDDEGPNENEKWEVVTVSSILRFVVESRLRSYCWQDVALCFVFEPTWAVVFWLTKLIVCLYKWTHGLYFMVCISCSSHLQFCWVKNRLDTCDVSNIIHDDMCAPDVWETNIKHNSQLIHVHSWQTLAHRAADQDT